jgi:hypothetical protein
MVLNGRFPTLIDLKIAKNAVLYLKLVNKIYSRDFFEEYMNFKIFCYLRLGGVIPVQSFGSNIRPQPPGLGFKQDQNSSAPSVIAL